MPPPGQHIAIDAVPNLRDLGGWRTPTGRVRSGLLYRSAEFSGLRGEDAAAFGRLGIRTVYDLRTEAERHARPDVVPAGIAYVVADILKDARGAAPAQLEQSLADPPAVGALLGGGRAVTLFEQGYRQIVGLPSALDGYHRFFTEIADPAYRPALFHCTAGKDRTGWAAAALLLLLGVAEDDVMADFLLTNEQLLPSLQPLIARFAAAGVDTALLTPVLGVERGYLEVAIDEMHHRHGTVDDYFATGLGLGSPGVDALRAAFAAR